MFSCTNVHVSKPVDSNSVTMFHSDSGLLMLMLEGDEEEKPRNRLKLSVRCNSFLSWNERAHLK